MRTLPRPLPKDPLPLLEQWLAAVAASGQLRNPNTMALATADAQGRPSVRMVLLKHLSVAAGFAVFYTHYGSRKGRELDANARAASALYWEELGVQVRLEGPVVRSPEAESDAYFATRPRGSRINALVSQQSSPLEDFDAFLRTMRETVEELGAEPTEASPEAGGPAIGRPAYWGGYRLWLEGVELWLEGIDRCHERVRYERTLTRDDAWTFCGGPWRSQRLQP